MKTLFKLSLLLSLSIACFAVTNEKACPQLFDSPVITVSGQVLNIQNDCGALHGTIAYTITGSPASMSAVLTGFMRGGSPGTVLDTYTGTTSVTRKPTFDTHYDYFTVVATFSGGTSPTFTVHSTLTTANGGSSGGTVTGSAPIVVTAGVVSCPTCGTGSGNTTGAASSTLNNAPVFGDGTGKLLADSGGPMPATLAPAGGQLLSGYNKSTGLFTQRALISGDIPNNAANTSGTSSNVSGTPALPNGTTATTQAATDATTKIATDAFVKSVFPAISANAQTGTTPCDQLLTATGLSVAGALGQDVILDFPAFDLACPTSPIAANFPGNIIMNVGHTFHLYNGASWILPSKTLLLGSGSGLPGKGVFTLATCYNDLNSYCGSNGITPVSQTFNTPNICLISCSTSATAQGYGTMAYNMTSDCSGLPGCVAFMNLYAQENSGYDHIDPRGWDNNGRGLWIGTSTGQGSGGNATYRFVNETNSISDTNRICQEGAVGIYIDTAGGGPKEISDITIGNTFCKTLETNNGWAAYPNYNIEVVTNGTIFLGKNHHETFEKNALLVGGKTTGYGAYFTAVTSGGDITSTVQVNGGLSYGTPTVKVYPTTCTGGTLTPVVSSGVITSLTKGGTFSGCGASATVLISIADNVTATGSTAVIVQNPEGCCVSATYTSTSSVVGIASGAAAEKSLVIDGAVCGSPNPPVNLINDVNHTAIPCTVGSESKFVTDASGNILEDASGFNIVNDMGGRAIQTPSGATVVLKATAQGTVNGISEDSTGHLAKIGTGSVDADKVNGATVPASSSVSGTNSSNQVIAAPLTNTHVYVGNVSNLPVDVAMSQDCTLSNTGVITCTKTNNVAFATSATTDTTNATNITSGNVSAARMVTALASLAVTNTTAVTVANPTAATDTILMALSIPASTFSTVGQPFMIHGSGVLTTTAASVPQVTISAKLCSVAGCGSGTVTPLAAIQSAALNTTAVTNASWNLNLIAIVTANGASCALMVKGAPGLTIETGATTATADSLYADSNTAASSPTQTCSNGLFIDFFVQQSTTGASNSYKQLAGMIAPMP